MKKLIIAAIAGMVISVGMVAAQARMDGPTRHREAQHASNRMRNNQRIAEKRNRKPKRAVTARPAKVQVDGQPLKGTVPTMKKNGTTFVALRPLFESLGATVTINNQDGFAIAERGASKWQIPLRGGQATVNGIPMTLKADETPFIHQGATMVPLHLIEAGLGEPAKPAPPRNNNRIKILSW